VAVLFDQLEDYEQLVRVEGEELELFFFRCAVEIYSDV
jgi:hypothetical protein